MSVAELRALLADLPDYMEVRVVGSTGAQHSPEVFVTQNCRGPDASPRVVIR